MPSTTSSDENRTGFALQRRAAFFGFALVEILVSALLVGAVAGTAVGAMVWSNRTAAIYRNQTAARLLCQGRIDQALSVPFSPPGSIPSFFGTWPIPTSDTVTSTENVELYSSETPSGTGTVPGQRITTVAWVGSPSNHVRFTVRVNYTYAGRNYTSEMYTLRTLD